MAASSILSISSIVFLIFLRSHTVDTPGNLIDIDANLLQLGGLRPDVAGVHVDDIPVNEHFPGIGGKVLRVKLGHFLLDQGPFFLRHRDAQHNVSCSVCHSFTVLSGQGFGAFPQQATGHGPQGQGRAGFRKCGYTSYACYVSSSPLLKRSQHVQLPAKYGISLKKGQKNKRALRPSGKTENRGCFHTSPVSFADCSIFSAPSIAPSMTGK